jgi:geranylgeranyl diphosphate synthase type II
MDRELMGQELTRRRERAEQILEKYLPFTTGLQKTVSEAMSYSLLAGGKRLRPILMLESYQLFGGQGQVIEPFAAAIEMIHTYSLVHDDLPAMDNDKYRRGKLTCHAKYGEAMGILAGDGLLNLAFETAGNAFDLTDEPAQVGRAIQVLAGKAGMYGMLGGQVIDVETEGASDLTMDVILEIHRLKTAALLEASLMVGGILAGAGERQLEMLEQIGQKVGIAFQIQDDILDVTGNQELLGKPVGSDAKNEKTTSVTLLGLEGTSAKVRELSRQAVELAGSLPGDTEFLRELIRMLTVRDH